MRNDREIKDTPVVMVTALCDAKDIDTASSFGISDYVTKPINFVKLIEKISNILSKKTSCSAKK
jgi:DNA-binding response OmpR family regulator